MSMRIIVCLLLSLLFSLKAEDQLECRHSKCFCNTVKNDEEGSTRRCSDKLYQQNLSMIQNLIHPPKNMSAFPYLELDTRHFSYFDVHIQIKCRNFNLKHNSTANTTLFDLIPKLNLHDIQSLILNQCPFPEEPFQVLFDILNVTKVNDFRIHFPTSAVRLSDIYFEEIPPLTSIIFTGKDSFSVKIRYEDPFGKGTTIIDKNLYALDPNVFQHLRNLKRLQIEGYNITTLDPSMFGNLTSLEYLIIYSNQIENLTRDLFSNLLNLKKLDISENKISVLKSDILEDLVNLRNFEAYGNMFQAFPPDLFSKTEKIESIFLSYNGPLFEGFLSNLPNLQEVFLEGSNILNELPRDLFWKSPNLRKLYLRGHTKLTHIPRELFRDSRKILKLDLSNNGLRDLEENTFEFIKELADLDLSHNQLNNITNDIFSRRDIKRSLEHLNLSHNKLKSIADKTFEKLYSLKSLDLSNNFLKLSPDEPYSYSQLKPCLNLETINLSNNQISQIYEDWIISEYVEHRKLDLTYNKITSIPDFVFHSTENEEYPGFQDIKIDLSYNQIEVIEFKDTPPTTKKKYSKTIKIILTGNPVACNCSNYDLFNFIQKPMSPNEFKTIKIEKSDELTCKPLNMPIKTMDLTKLPCDNVAGCPTACKCTYSPQHDQIIVNCTSANLTRIPQNLNITLVDKRAIPWHLREKKNRTIQLVLRNNSIQEFFPDTSENYTLVTDLDLSLNKIRDEKDITRHLPILETLDLSHNQLESLSSDFVNLLKSSSNVSSIFLYGNKWKCDCRITDLYNFNTENPQILKDFKNITCDDSRLLYKKSKEDFCPSLTGTIVSIVLAVLVVLLVLVSFLYYKYQQEIKVWLFAHRILLCWLTEEDVDTDKVYDAFVSYNEEDYRIVVKELIPQLDKNYKVCHHERDFIGGRMITEQIEEKVYQSRRTIIVLTEDFLKSYWGMYEFRTAHTQAKKDNCLRVILIILGDMPPQESIPDDMKAYINTHTYIKWGDKWFWEKLKYALPHPPARLSHDFHNAFAQSNTTQNASNSMPMQNITGSNPTQVCSATSVQQRTLKSQVVNSVFGTDVYKTPLTHQIIDDYENPNSPFNPNNPLSPYNPHSPLNPSNSISPFNPSSLYNPNHPDSPL
uniref:Protein toll n=1 Tax=Cacopsylla melanoneura TaxID=428564 RepID=A0A8D9F9P7_9HEMI